MSLVLRGGRVIDQAGERLADVEVGDDGRIANVGDGCVGEVELDASGCVVAPGFVDLHAHLREPGQEDAETIETGARGGALGGYTALVAMPNTQPAMDCAAVVEQQCPLQLRQRVDLAHPLRGLDDGRLVPVPPAAAEKVQQPRR